MKFSNILKPIKQNKNIISILSLCLILVAFQGCQKTTTKNSSDPSSTFTGIPKNTPLETALKEVEDYPELHETHFDLAAIYSYMGKRDKAIAEFTLALEIDPENLNTTAALATEYCLSGEKEKAEMHYKKLEDKKFAQLKIAKDILNKHCP